MLPLLIFLVFSWAQILEPVNSLNLNSHQLLASANENALLSKAHLGTDELQLFQRGLENQKSNVEGNEDANQIPALNAKEAISSIVQIVQTRSQLLNIIAASITRIMRAVGESPLSDLFGHIRNLIRNPNSISQYPRISLPLSDAFHNNFSRDALLEAVGELSNKSVEDTKKFLQMLKRNFKNTEMEALFTNITVLLENQATLQKFSELSGNVDKAFGLDKPMDLASLGLPVPTEENPTVYFELKDDRNPWIKFLVKIKMEEDEIVETILIQTDESGGRISSKNVFTASNDEKGLEDLYKKLPISKLVQH